MFTEIKMKPFFIRKNTKELRRKLKKCNISPNPFVDEEDLDNETAFLWVVPSMEFKYIQYIPCTYTDRIERLSIDCGYNEEEFLNYVIKFSNLINITKCLD